MEILAPILIVSLIGLLAGVILAVASIVMAVPKDEKAEALEEVLPGANCGACGYSGCPGYAAAMAKGEASPGLCSPGGEAVAKQCAEILGSGDVAVVRKVALVHCLGSCDNTGDKMEYDGIPSCAAALPLAGGAASCTVGPLSSYPVRLERLPPRRRKNPPASTARTARHSAEPSTIRFFISPASFFCSFRSETVMPAALGFIIPNRGGESITFYMRQNTYFV